MIMGTALSPEIRLGVGKITANVLGTIQVLINLPSTYYFHELLSLRLPPVAVLLKVPL